MIKVEVADLAGLSREQAAAFVRRRTAAEPEEDQSRPKLPTIDALNRVLPGGGLDRGAVVSYAGSSSPLLGMLAAATAAGEYTALINTPDRHGAVRSLHAFYELGGALSRLFAVNCPTDDDRLITVLHNLMDGVSLVVSELHPRLLPPSRAKILFARAASRRCTLVLLGPEHRIGGVDLRLSASCVGLEGLGPGRGRITAQTFRIEATGRDGRTRSGDFRKGPRPGGRMDWEWVEPSAEVIGLSTRAG
ncbi:hypothetical protein [Nocardia salmonicida]|uniref:hypothetical protein n=1 Tax=Nocardia salmonicida TaxID=53431 RepID=UPI0012F529BF|nr:hypothetical protein [Nocardia salmonicida]MBC7299529.1 hypothetical protein [Nocardia sp.]